jgi:hypothetical protein
MQEDGKAMQERLETILKESRLLAQDAGHRVASAARWAYKDVLRRFGWQEGAEAEEAEAAPEAGAGETTPEGYAAGQLWQPRDPSKKSRKIIRVERKGEDHFVIWESPGGGQENRIKEASFTRWVRREHASVKK